MNNKNVLIMILVLIIICLIGYICYDKLIIKNDTIENINNVVENSKNDSQQDIVLPKD